MGALWMLFAGLSFACMGVLVKLGTAHFSSSELVFYRSFFGLLLIAAMLLHRRTPLSTPHWRGHLWRGFSGTIAMMLYFYCIATLPLATAITLNYTSSMFLTALTLIVYKDRFHLPLTASLTLGFVGVVLLLHPTFEREQFVSGLLGLASGFLAGVALMNVRQLGQLGEPAVRVVFYFNLVATALQRRMDVSDRSASDHPERSGAAARSRRIGYLRPARHDARLPHRTDASGQHTVLQHYRLRQPVRPVDLA